MHSSDQFLLDFTSRANERCSKLLGLRVAPLSIDMTRGRIEGVIELLQRLTLLCRDLPDHMTDDYSVDAQVVAIAAKIDRRKTVSEKTVRNWTADAKLLGLITVDYASQQYGGSRWNTYTIHFSCVQELVSGVAGNGRKRAVMVTAPGAVTATAPISVLTNESDKHSPLTLERSNAVVVSAFFDDSNSNTKTVAGDASHQTCGTTDIETLVSLGMSSDGARGAVAKALGRGLTHAQIGELVELYREASARDPRMTAGWLYRWLSGQSAPPKASGSAPKPLQVDCGGRGDGLTRHQQNAERLRIHIVRTARAAGASEDEIRQRCQAAGVEY